ncbi:MAG: hypothetical protein ACPGXX_02900 [Planctomycetaceae bacterium]
MTAVRARGRRVFGLFLLEKNSAIDVEQLVQKGGNRPAGSDCILSTPGSSLQTSWRSQPAWIEQQSVMA